MNGAFRIAFLLLIPALLPAAVIRGVVVENQSGKPLARAVVVAAPVAGTTGGAQSARTDSNGVFEFPPMPGGAYLVTASRRAFAPWQYGQKQWRGAGVPVVLDEASTTFLNIRLQRYGSILGTVLDENDVGLPEHEVVIYKSARPPKLVSRVKTDDRGMYHIWGLEPGLYLIRTVGKQYEEGSYLPTFARETSRVDEARPVEVFLDQQSTDANVRPFPGRLFQVSGRAFVSPNAQVTLTLASDIGYETATTDNQGNFQFPPTPPGPYEIFAQASTGRGIQTTTQTAYSYITVDRDRSDYRLSLAPPPELQVTVEDRSGKPIDGKTLQFLGRHKDLSGESNVETLRLPQGRMPLQPGRWDLSMMVNPTWYVAEFSAPGMEGARGRADGWNEVVAAAGQIPVKFVLGDHPGAIHGTVVTPAKDAVAGAPVFLEPYDADMRRRAGDIRVTKSDTKGQYQFFGLAPGDYRLFSTFEFQMPDAAQMDGANPKSVKAEQGRSLTVDLELYVIR